MKTSNIRRKTTERSKRKLHSVHYSHIPRHSEKQEEAPEIHCSCICTKNYVKVTVKEFVNYSSHMVLSSTETVYKYSKQSYVLENAAFTTKASLQLA